MKVNVALIQMTHVETSAQNLEKAIGRIREAAGQGARIVSVSELFLSKYFCQTNDRRFFSLAETIPGPNTGAFSKLAKELGIVIVGSFFEKDGKDHYNTAVVFDADGSVLGKYRKLHIPDDPGHHYSELFYFKPGNLGLPVFKTHYGTIGVSVCWDQWYPENARVLAEKGAQIIFYPTAIGWPVSEKGKDVAKTEFDAWVTIQRSHAIANGVFIAAANRTGLEQNLDFWGGSFVSDPFGKVLQQAGHDREEIILSACDLSRIQEVRESWPFLDCRRMKIAEPK
ncbi:MAG: carbon-nitrogen hydrolase [Deltaproteobacteria bacterium]|nr:carbon-nitrogen hydrolase [Deltaproteobacteria bacterium]